MAREIVIAHQDEQDLLHTLELIWTMEKTQVCFIKVNKGRIITLLVWMVVMLLLGMLAILL